MKKIEIEHTEEESKGEKISSIYGKVRENQGNLENIESGTKPRMRMKGENVFIY